MSSGEALRYHWVIGDMSMTKVGRQNRQTALGILSGLVPAYKRSCRKHVPHVMQPRTVTVGCPA